MMRNDTAKRKKALEDMDEQQGSSFDDPECRVPAREKFELKGILVA